MHNGYLQARLRLLAAAVPRRWRSDYASQFRPRRKPLSETVAENDEEILVTGSRIARAGFDQPTPTTVIGEGELRLGARPNIQQVLNDLPQIRPTTTPSVSNGNTSTGTAPVDMRGLGSNRTLVPLDGRRFVGEGNLNFHPHESGRARRGCDGWRFGRLGVRRGRRRRATSFSTRIMTACRSAAMSAFRRAATGSAMASMRNSARALPTGAAISSSAANMSKTAA